MLELVEQVGALPWMLDPGQVELDASARAQPVADPPSFTAHRLAGASRREATIDPPARRSGLRLARRYPAIHPSQDGTLVARILGDTLPVIAGMLGTVEILILLVLGGGVPLAIGVFTYRAGFNAGLAKGRAETIDQLSQRR